MQHFDHSKIMPIISSQHLIKIYFERLSNKVRIIKYNPHGNLVNKIGPHRYSLHLQKKIYQRQKKPVRIISRRALFNNLF